MTSEDLDAQLSQAPVVPLIDEGDTQRAVAITNALADGGLRVIEVVLRSPGALSGMEAILRQRDDLTIGAGTVLTREQAETVIDRGAQFVVCPGLVDDVVRYCSDRGVPCLPGTMTAGEVQRAYALGLRTVKFFPAGLAGGVPMLKALGSVFSEMRFMPTGGVGANNLSDYLALPQVVACGGSWLTPKDAVAKGDYEAISALAAEAVSIAKSSRG